MQKCCNPTRRLTIMAIITQLRLFIDFLINKNRNNQWSLFISKLLASYKKFWMIAKSLSTKFFKKQNLVVNGKEITNDV